MTLLQSIFGLVNAGIGVWAIYELFALGGALLKGGSGSSESEDSGITSEERRAKKPVVTEVVPNEIPIANNQTIKIKGKNFVEETQFLFLKGTMRNIITGNISGINNGGKEADFDIVISDDAREGDVFDVAAKNPGQPFNEAGIKREGLRLSGSRINLEDIRITSINPDLIHVTHVGQTFQISIIGENFPNGIAFATSDDNNAIISAPVDTQNPDEKICHLQIRGSVERELLIYPVYNGVRITTGRFPINISYPEPERINISGVQIERILENIGSADSRFHKLINVVIIGRGFETLNPNQIRIDTNKSEIDESQVVVARRAPNGSIVLTVTSIDLRPGVSLDESIRLFIKDKSTGEEKGHFDFVPNQVRLDRRRQRSGNHFKVLFKEEGSEPIEVSNYNIDDIENLRDIQEESSITIVNSKFKINIENNSSEDYVFDIRKDSEIKKIEPDETDAINQQFHEIINSREYTTIEYKLIEPNTIKELTIFARIGDGRRARYKIASIKVKIDSRRDDPSTDDSAFDEDLLSNIGGLE